MNAAEPQSTHHLLLVKPASFYMNEETAGTNSFQHNSTLSAEEITQRMAAEFDSMVLTLVSHGVTVTVFNGPEGSPDSIFPNNIFSTHADGTLVTYPLLTANRQAEWTPALETFLTRRYAKRLDFRNERAKGHILESTGSLVLDRVNRRAYVCLSPRADRDLCERWIEAMGYQLVSFEAYEQGQAIYHTNVVMYVGSTVAGVCLECMPPADQEKVAASLNETGHQLLALSLEQLRHMAGNALEVMSATDERLLVMSSQAYQALTSEQLTLLEAEYASLIHVPLDTIETHGGGSARCMLAELY